MTTVTSLPRKQAPADTARYPPRRILYLEANDDHTVGGSHRSLFELVTHVDRRAFEPVVVYYQENCYIEKLRERGVEVHVAAFHEQEKNVHLNSGRLRKSAAVLLAVWTRARFLHRNRIDLVHINNSPRVGFDDWLPAARLLGIPCMASERGDGAPIPSPRWLKQRLYRSFDRVVPVGEHLVPLLQQAGFCASRIRRVHNGIDLDGFRRRVRSSVRHVRGSLGVQLDRLLILHVGNIRPWKGQDVLLRALAAVGRDVRTRLHVCFAGASSPADSLYEQDLHDMADTFGLQGCVSFLGFRDDVPDLMNAADVVVHSSLEPEPFGLVIIEAMCLGKVVVAANAGGPDEIITDDSGVTFDPHQPRQLGRILTRLAGDPVLRNDLGNRAREVVTRFSIKNTARRMQGIYGELLTQE